MTCLESRILKLATAYLRFVFLAGDQQDRLCDEFIAPERTPATHDPLNTMSAELMEAIDDLVATRRALIPDEYDVFCGRLAERHLCNAAEELRTGLRDAAAA